MRAPLEPAPATSVVTGRPATYRDPATGHAFSDATSYRRLHGGQGPPASASVAAPANGGAAMEMPPARTGPYDLPPALMALVVDLHTTLAHDRRQQWLYQQQRNQATQ